LKIIESVTLLDPRPFRVSLRAANDDHESANRSYFQISAPVQPGNSGGPLIDEYTNLVGVVASKLDVLLVARITNDVPQNIKFAIKSIIATNFFDSIGLETI
jgi:S1-C subfamily serine protease